MKRQLASFGWKATLIVSRGNSYLFVFFDKPKVKKGLQPSEIFDLISRPWLYLMSYTKTMESNSDVSTNDAAKRLPVMKQNDFKGD